MKNFQLIFFILVCTLFTQTSCEEKPSKEGILIGEMSNDHWKVICNETQFVKALSVERKMNELSESSVGILVIGKKTFVEVKGMEGKNSYHSILELSVKDNRAYLERRAGGGVDGQSCKGDPCSKCKIITTTTDGGCSCKDGQSGSKCNHSVWTELSAVFWGEFKLVAF